MVVDKVYSVCKTQGEDIMTEMYCRVTGKVQGVAYRDYVQSTATKLGLTGWVRNESDGSVSVCVQGPTDDLKDMVEYLNEGSSLAKVDDVSVEWRSAQETFHEFSVLH